MSNKKEHQGVWAAFKASWHRRWWLVPMAAVIPFSPFANFYIRPHLLRWAGIKVGEKCIIRQGIEITEGKLVIGNYVAINAGCRLACGGGLTIGDYSQIGPRVSFETSGHSIDPRPFGHRPLKAQPIVVEDYVWIGANALILGGVTIGRGSVVAAGAVVTKHVPPHTLVAGVPAKVIRQLDAVLETTSGVVQGTSNR